jgi:hypothetical protein
MTDTPIDDPGDAQEPGEPGHDTDLAKTDQERLAADPALEPQLAHERDEAAKPPPEE